MAAEPYIGVGRHFTLGEFASPSVRRATYPKVFMMAAMSETEMDRFREVTLHPAKLISRLPKGMSFVFSPACYPEPFFVALIGS